MKTELCFVQFLHPGVEHKPDQGTTKLWNKASHRRKFIKNYGRYVKAGEVEEGELVFWGEWEPESDVVARIDELIPNGPNFIYKPYYVVPASYNELQNTDPFVFGDRFYYEGCQQRTKKGATQLLHLARGSVILFGSCLNEREFGLDTVFVVDDWIEHSRTTFTDVLCDVVPDAYKVVTISPWYHEAFGEAATCIKSTPSDSWRLYRGASYEEKLNGMFSFFPCSPYVPGSSGFARPVIRIDQVITNSQKQKYVLNKRENQSEVLALWREVVRQVEKRELGIGIVTEMPKRKPGWSNRVVS
jgi:hypothetical protein